MILLRMQQKCRMQHSFLWILKTNIFLYKINKCSKKPYLYRFIGLKMSYNANIQKICLEICSINRGTNIGQEDGSYVEYREQQEGSIGRRKICGS